MPQNSEVELFLQRVSALPNDQGTSLDDLLKPAIEIERELWTLFATDKSHERLTDAHVGLVDVFDAPDSIRTTRARLADNEDLSARYIMPLTQENRRIKGPCMLNFRTSRRTGTSSLRDRFRGSTGTTSSLLAVPFLHVSFHFPRPPKARGAT